MAKTLPACLPVVLLCSARHWLDTAALSPLSLHAIPPRAPLYHLVRCSMLCAKGFRTCWYTSWGPAGVPPFGRQTVTAARPGPLHLQIVLAMACIASLACPLP